MRAIRGADEHDEFVYLPADDFLIDLASPGGNWGFGIVQVLTPEGAANMRRHYGLKDWATEERLASLSLAIEYWAADKNRKSRKDWFDDLLTDRERSGDSDED